MPKHTIMIEFEDGTMPRKCSTLAEAEDALDRYGYFPGATYDNGCGATVTEYWRTPEAALMDQDGPSPACLVMRGGDAK